MGLQISTHFVKQKALIYLADDGVKNIDFNELSILIGTKNQ